MGVGLRRILGAVVVSSRNRYSRKVKQFVRDGHLSQTNMELPWACSPFCQRFVVLSDLVSIVLFCRDSTLAWEGDTSWSPRCRSGAAFPEEFEAAEVQMEEEEDKNLATAATGQGCCRIS